MNEEMDEETLEAIKQKYELSVITYKEAQKVVVEKKTLLESVDYEIQRAKTSVSNAITSMNKNRDEYETALYKFWEINNE